MARLTVFYLVVMAVVALAWGAHAHDDETAEVTECYPREVCVPGTNFCYVVMECTRY